eukprot:UN4796
MMTLIAINVKANMTRTSKAVMQQRVVCTRFLRAVDASVARSEMVVSQKRLALARIALPEFVPACSLLCYEAELPERQGRPQAAVSLQALGLACCVEQCRSAQRVVTSRLYCRSVCLGVNVGNIWM